MTRRRTWVVGLAMVASLAYVHPGAAAEPTRPGRVANTDGAALRLRAAPSEDAAIIKRLGPGWRVTILGGPSGDGRWLRVEHGGLVGYAAVGYIAADEAVPPPAPVRSSADEARRPGRVVNTEGANLRVRAAPNAEAAILKRLGPGWSLSVLGEPVQGGLWVKVEHGGTIGYAAAAYVATGAEAAAASLPPVPAAAPPAAPQRAAWVANTDGAALNLRVQPSTSAALVKKIAPGTRVTIVGAPVTDATGRAWVRVEHDGAAGYAVAEYLAGTAAGGGAGGAGVVAPVQRAEPGGVRLMTTESARLRDEPGLDGAIVTRVQAGTVVERTGRQVQADGYTWASVRAFGRDGWMVADALGPRPGPDTGQKLVAEAMAQIGRPYVWGGETPQPGFDCSGLVRWVVERVTGVDLTHVLAYQAEAGSPVDRADLQAGDMVFFKDTYKPGLSHVGFYIGNGQFVNAENEARGVARASLETRYWSSRYLGARRIGE